MKAIMLSFDKHHPYCELSYRMYEKLWPEHPFIFRIPWNNKVNISMQHKRDVELVKCDKSIKLTMQALLHGIQDDEWVYWCIDDRFPVEIDQHKMNRVHQDLSKYSQFDFVRPFHHEQIALRLKPFTNDQNFMIQNTHQHLGFYMHQFCKARVLKSVFLSCEYETIREVHQKNVWINRRKTAPALSSFKGLMINEQSNGLISFEEPCIGGVQTQCGTDYINMINIKN